jgi:hypothetical protein
LEGSGNPLASRAARAVRLADGKAIPFNVLDDPRLRNRVGAVNDATDHPMRSHRRREQAARIDRFKADTLFDENFGGAYGNCHIALGSSYMDTYSGNPADITQALKKKLGFNDSALHWDLVNTERKTVTAHLRSGEKCVVYDNGRFQI